MSKYIGSELPSSSVKSSSVTSPVRGCALQARNSSWHFLISRQSLRLCCSSRDDRSDFLSNSFQENHFCLDRSLKNFCRLVKGTARGTLGLFPGGNGQGSPWFFGMPNALPLMFGPRRARSRRGCWADAATTAGLLREGAGSWEPVGGVWSAGPWACATEF